MIQIKLFKDNKSVLIPLQEHLDASHSEVHPAWNEYMNWVNEGMNISNDEEYQNFIEKLNLKYWNVEKVNTFYIDLLESKLSQLFDNEILKFIAHLYGLGYFDRINNPELKKWINIKAVFKQKRELIPENEKYSLMDLVKLRNGMNAIKKELLFALKW